MKFFYYNLIKILGFREPDIPSATCVAYSPINHFAYVGNRKGDVKIYDLRMHKIIQKIVAHESSVKAITIDKDEYYMATGSSEGNIKVCLKQFLYNYNYCY